MDTTDSKDPFRFRHRVTVRFRDIDALGHAHHAESLTYFEEARWAYWDQVVAPADIERVEYVMAEATVRWHARVFWPAALVVGVRVTRIGRKHFEMAYEVRSEDGEKLVSGHSTQVMFDAGAGRSRAMPDDIRAALEAFDGPFDSG